MPAISPQLLPVLMLFASNVFMTFAWYGHLKYKESWLPLAILASWGVQVPGPVGGPAALISRILFWCGISLAIAAVLVWCVMGWWKRLVVEPPAAAPAGPAAA